MSMKDKDCDEKNFMEILHHLCFVSLFLQPLLNLLMLLSKGKVVKALDSLSTRFTLISVSKGNVSESFQNWVCSQGTYVRQHIYHILEILGYIKVAHMVLAQIPVAYILSFNIYLKV